MHSYNIQEKHREDFKDVDYLADMLAFAFESMNTYASDHTFSFHIPLTVKQSKNAGEWAQKICEWVTYVSSDSDRTETTHIMTHLRTLQSLKQNQIEELIDPTIWPNLFLSKPIILQYLKLVIVFYKHNEAVDDLLQQIITLIDIDVMKSGSFDLCYIADYLYPKINSQEPCKLKCRDVLNLHFVIQQVVEQMKMRTTKNAASKKYLITRYLEQLFEQYTNYLHKANQNYELLLLHTLLYPLGYNNKENLFYQLLDIDELEYLAKEFNEPIIVFFKECGNTYTDLKVQAYIFYLTFNAISSGQIIDLIPKAKIHVQYLREKLGTKINAKISCILDATDDWAMLKSHMFTEFKGNKIQTIKGRDLMEILEASPSSPPHENDKIQKLSLKAVRKPLYADRFNALLQTLNLKDKYPEKLTKDDALVIRSSVLKAVDGTDQLHLLPYLVLHKIMICDTKCRADLIINTNKLHQPEISTYKSGKADINTEEDVCSSSSSASSASDNSSSSSDNDCEDENNISPIDVILVLLYCSDNLLRQILLQKLSLCQLAIPCLLPDPFSGDIKYLLWSMQSITKAWKKSLEKASYEECRIVHYKGPIISFMRIGTIRKDFKSKSTILNNILSDSKQEIFFTWNSDGGSYKKLTTNGVVDLCWYLPSGHEKSDLYHDPITFLNLHGNASGYPLQLNFIENVSTMLFFVIGDKEELNHDIVAILKKLLVEGGVVLMFYSKKAKKHACHKLKNSASKLYFIMLKGKNDSELRKTIHHVIQQKLQSLPPKHKLLSLNDCAQYANELQFMIDENDPSCNYGKKLAKCIMTEIESYSDEETKSKLLPLQSQSMWHQWAKHDKERYRHTMKHNISIEDYNLLKDSEKLAIRTLQIEKSDSVSPAMGMFLSSMLSCDNNTKKYFLEWLKFLLDDYSRKIIPNIFIKHQEIRSKIFKHKEIALTNSITMKELKYQLKKYSEQLISASFGIEHFFREVSQIYEARMDPMQTGIPTHLKELLSRLPLMVANLISEGYPIELLDGEASHVPITWVSHVLNNLMLLYQGKKIFTISVLGIQSTGKSTLLNTMFGLQFNTSAGRCTKGVFFQLLTVDSELQEKIKCDLILIIDTEGLRAPELQLDGSQTHDNELATFVIGLADVTVINIKGEAPADLNDILQTAVHAFIRMKRMTIHPRCHFVHHNIDDVTASDKTKLGRQKFLENLDVITESAAKIELCDSHLNSFKDVITFNEEVDVHFFPNLLKGDLSNPSVNPEYSKKAQELSSLLLQQACNMQNSEPPIPLCTFAGFEVRIKHLWDAVLQENYIFSFKNSLEIVAYNELDIILNHWSWKFQCGILEWRYQAENKINSTNSSSELEIVCEHCLGNARLISSEICNSVKQEFQEFFKQNKYKSTIAQWEAHTEHKISKLGEQFDENASHICNNLKARQQEFLKIQDLLRNQQCKLQHQITELVKSSKRESIEFSDEQLTVLFEDNWNEWKKEFVSVQFFTVDDIYTTAEVQLKKVFPQQYYYIKQQLDNQSLKQRKPTHFVLDQAKHVSSQRGIFKNLKEKDFREANFKSIEFMKVIDHKLLAEDCQNFNSIMIFAPLNELQKSISQFHSNEKKKFVFTQVYISEIAVHVSIHIIDRCKILLRQYKQKHDPLIILEEQKPTFKKSFVNQYNQISSDITAAENFCQLLVKPIKMQILKEFPDMIVRYMKQKVTFHSKQAFKCKILKDLANNNKFEDYIYYIQDIEGSFKKWAGDYIDEHCDEVNAEQESKLTEFSTRKLNNICDTITDSAKVTSLKSNLTVLLREFHKNLNGVIELNPTKLTDITGIDTLTDCQLFLKEVIAGAITIKEDLLKVLQDPQSGFVTDLKNVSKHSVGLLANSLQGCTATCPFCNEQCEMSVPNHIEVDPKFHSVKIHRPICLATYRDQKSRKLVPDLCTKVVGSKLKFISKESKNKSVKFKKYQDIYPKWYIPYDIREVPKYWRWFVFNYNDQIASEYDAEPANVDPSWRWITINEAIDSLQETYNF